jgi:hypothetical protein
VRVVRLAARRVNDLSRWWQAEACLTAERGDGGVDGLDENALAVKLH